MLQNLLDPRCEKSLQESDLKVVLRVVKTVLWQFHVQLKNKCGVFLETLLGGESCLEISGSYPFRVYLLLLYHWQSSCTLTVCTGSPHDRKALDLHEDLIPIIWLKF